MNAVIGALRLQLGLDSAQFQQGVKNANTGMQKFASQMKVVAAGAAAALAGITAGLMRAAGRADEMGKVAAGLGVGVQEISKLRHAAEMSGVSFGNLQTGVRNLSQAMANLTDANSPAVQALGRLGIETKNADGTMRSTSSVMEDIADRFAKMENGAQKTALAVALFGRAGASMIPMLNGGSAGLKEMGDQAERLGLVIDQKTATASERFNDNLALLGKSMEGVFNKVLAQVAPAFEQLSFRLMDAVHGSGVLDGMAKVLAGTMNVLARGITIVFDNLHHLYDLLKVYAAAGAVRYTVALAGTFIQLARAVRVAGVATALFTSVTRAKITTLALMGAVLAKVTGTYDAFVAGLRSVGDAVMSALPDSLRQGLENLSAGFKGLADDITAIDESVAKNMATYIGYADDAAAAFGNVGAKGKSAADDANASWQGVGHTLASVRTPLDDLRDGMQQFAGGLANAFTSALDGSKKLGDSIADLLKQLGQMLLNRAFTPLTGSTFTLGLAGVK